MRIETAAQMNRRIRRTNMQLARATWWEAHVDNLRMLALLTVVLGNHYASSVIWEDRLSDQRSIVTRVQTSLMELQSWTRSNVVSLTIKGQRRAVAEMAGDFSNIGGSK